MSDIAAISAAVSATGASGVQGSIAVSVLASSQQQEAQLASILMASLGIGQGVSAEA